MLAFAEQPDRLLEFRRNAQRAREVLNWEGEEEILATLLRRCLHGPHRGEA
jgi:hypothetical protein